MRHDNSMKNILETIRVRAISGLYAAFVPLADVSESPKLQKLYDSDQDLSTYINSLFTIAIAAGAIFAVLRLAYAGYLYMGSDMWGKKQDARNIIRDVFIGLLLLLSIWIILHQINPNLLNLKIAFSELPKQQVVTPAQYNLRGVQVSETEQQRMNAILADEPNARRQLAGRVSINKAPCAYVGQPSCTNVGNVGQNAINGLLRTKAACSCDMIVTGGSEFWLHETHGAQKNIVDLANTNTLNKYLTGSSADPPNGTTVRKEGGLFKFESAGASTKNTGTHWHVVF
ncbi:MAG: hypothetical protein UY63_C0011G0006 [Parcubacteria group bacterium GW2011_GWA2_51_10]|nr:MAG: hypothetical protein UY63_C0011G0006 [Parcubacteria group bacterium GW2011_GWA2_51_10]